MASTRTYDVPDITCGHCKESIESELAGVAGVDAVEVDIEAKTVDVTGSVSDEAVRAALDAIGYDVAGVT